MRAPACVPCSLFRHLASGSGEPLLSGSHFPTSRGWLGVMLRPLSRPRTGSLGPHSQPQALGTNLCPLCSLRRGPPGPPQEGAWSRAP